MKPYIVRIVSISSGSGKTMLIERIASYLSSRGYRFAVVKHAAKGLDIDDKDSARALRAGAPIAAVSGPGIAALYIANWIDDLEKALELVAGAPIVLVEGYRGLGLGDAVAVIKDLHDLENLGERQMIAVTSLNRELVDECRARGYPAHYIDSDEIPKLIESRALEHLVAQLPRADCGFCGYTSCRAFAEAYLKGETAFWCPRASEIRLKVDGIEIPMNPFVKNMLRNIVNGFIESLKNVPRTKRKINIEIELQ